MEGDDCANAWAIAPIDHHRADEIHWGKKTVPRDRGKPSNARCDPVHRDLAPGEHGLEHHANMIAASNDRPEQWMKKNRVKAMRPSQRTGASLMTADAAISRARLLKVNEVRFDVLVSAASGRRKHVVEG